MTPRGDNALFWGLAFGVLGGWFGSAILMVLSLFGVPLSDYVIALSVYGTGIPVGCVAAYVTWRRGAAKQWAREGRCRSCGYDLTGNVSGRCPECGALVSDGHIKR